MITINEIQEYLGNDYIASHTDEYLFIYNKKKNKNATVSHHSDDFKMSFKEYNDRILNTIKIELDK